MDVDKETRKEMVEKHCSECPWKTDTIGPKPACVHFDFDDCEDVVVKCFPNEK